MPLHGRKPRCLLCGELLPPGLKTAHISCRLNIADIMRHRDPPRPEYNEAHETAVREERLRERGRHLAEAMKGKEE